MTAAGRKGIVVIMSTLKFILTHEAWYYSPSLSAVNPGTTGREIFLQAYGPGFLYEFVVVEFKFGLRVCVFDDAWSAFTDFPELFKALLPDRSGRTKSLEELVKCLHDMGFEDITQRTMPS